MLRLLLLLGAAGTPGCVEPKEPSQQPALPPGAQLVQSTAVPELPVAQYASGMASRTRKVINDSNDWRATWTQIFLNQQPPPPVPTVDFNSDMIVLAAMGSRNSGGYSIAIEGIYRAGSKLYAIVRETSPGKGCMTTQALTAPVVAVRLARSNLPLEFLERKTDRDCG